MDLRLSLITGLVIAFQVVLGCFRYQGLVDCLRLTRIDVPSAVLAGDPAWLNCSFDLETEALYSVKWYFGKAEFYRYLPSEEPQVQIYDSSGIYVDLEKSMHGNVFLWKTDLSTEGLFRCEISAEAPSFQTVRKEAEMKIYYLPETGPTIVGVKPKYEVGDLVNITCRTGQSKPEATLTWLINDEEAPMDFIRREPNYQITNNETRKLKNASLGLEFVVSQVHFSQGTRGRALRLRCKAVISQVFSKASEQIIVADQSKSSRYYTVHEGDGPVISGAKATYGMGEMVNVTCTSAKSKPASELKWFVNDREAESHFVRRYSKVQFSDGNEITRLGLGFVVTGDYFEDASSGPSSASSLSGKRRRFFKKDHQHIRLKCTSTLSKVIDIGSDETIIGSNQRTSGLRAAENKAGTTPISGTPSSFPSMSTNILLGLFVFLVAFRVLKTSCAN